MVGAGVKIRRRISVGFCESSTCCVDSHNMAFLRWLATARYFRFESAQLFRLGVCMLLTINVALAFQRGIMEITDIIVTFS